MAHHYFSGRSVWPRFSGPEPMLCLSAGRTSATANLLAVGSRSRLQVLRVVGQPLFDYDDVELEGYGEEEDELERRLAAGGMRLAAPQQLIQFDVDAAICAMAWSPVASGPAPGDEDVGTGVGSGGGSTSMRIELAVALEDRRVVILSFAAGARSSVALGQVSGRVNSLDWLNVGDTSYIAAAQDDGTLTIWTLEPLADNGDDENEGANRGPLLMNHEPERTRQTFRYPTPLLTAAFHPDATGMLLVLDAAGSLKLLDWLDPSLPFVSSHPSLDAEPSNVPNTLSARRPKAHHVLVDPRAYAGARATGRGRSAGAGGGTGSASWKPQDENVVGALLDGRWSIWDTRTSAGNGLPVEQGEAYSERGGGGFKWCPTNAQLFLTFSTAPNSAPAGGMGRAGAGRTGGADADDCPVTIYDRSSLTLSAPRRIARSTLLPFEINAAAMGLGPGSAQGSRLASSTSAVRGERVLDVEWIGSALGGGVGNNAGHHSHNHTGSGGSGLGDVVAVAMGAEVVFVTLALVRN
ncbi:hypothetical protein OC842_002080 [Tilletia horrida]|uniref:Uncharacterized protein n=1 Tax=Tilletia horrida TaxID=155126 RepID=A0AAN6JMP8_9BASI|nr:hypothetical protein OC842_002080 [Tilletia horrida]